MLRRYWAPVGSTLMPPDEVAFVTSYLFSGSDGEAMTARIDRRLDRLPGLAGLDLAQRAVRRLVPVCYSSARAAWRSPSRRPGGPA